MRVKSSFQRLLFDISANNRIFVHNEVIHNAKNKKPVWRSLQGHSGSPPSCGQTCMTFKPSLSSKNSSDAPYMHTLSIKKTTCHKPPASAGCPKAFTPHYLARSCTVTEAWVNLDSAPWPKPIRTAEHSKQALDLEKTQGSGDPYVYSGETTLSDVLLCLQGATVSRWEFADLGSKDSKK